MKPGSENDDPSAIRALSSGRAVPVLTVRMIGGFSAQIGGQPVAIQKRKAEAVLALIAMQRGHRIPRETLRGILWADSSETDAQNSLRNVLWFLKSALTVGTESIIGIDRRFVWLEPQNLTVDVDDILVAVERGQLPRELAADPTFADRLLAEMEPISDLLAARIREYRDGVVRRLSNGIEAAADRTTGDARIRHMRLLATMHPLDEGICRNLMTELAARNLHGEALTAYQALWNALDEAFGEEPSPETQALVVALKTREEAAPQDRKPAKDGVVVLRPTILVGRPRIEGHARPEDRAIFEFLREDLVGHLARFREWQVRDLSHFAEGAGTPDAGEHYRLDLSFRPKRAEASRLRATLYRAALGDVLWSDEIDLSGDLGDSVWEIARRLALSVNVHIAGNWARRLDDAEGSPHDAYDRWLRAQDLITTFTRKSWSEAEAELDRLIVDHPRFGRAFSSRAGIENFRHVSFPGLYSLPAMHVRALALSAQALSLDPMDSRAQLAMGWSSAMARQFDRAELAFELAWEYNRNDPWTIASSGVGLAFCGQGAAATARLDTLTALGFQLQPAHWSYVAAARFMTGDFAGSVVASERSNEVSYDVPAWHAAALAHLGRTEEARIVGARFLELSRSNWSGDQQPRDEEIGRWIVSAYPIRNPEVERAFVSGLAAAGIELPTA